MNVEIADCLPEELPALKRFIAEQYRPTYILLKDSFFYWFLRDHPWNEERKITVKKISYRGNIVGMLGYQIHQMKCLGSTLRGAIFCNLMVSPSYRSLGFGPRLIDAVTNEYPMCLVTGFNPDSAYLYSAMEGWGVLGTLTRYVCVMHPERIRAIMPPVLVSQFPSPIVRRDASVFLFLRLLSCDERVDLFWERISRQYEFCTERTSAYLNWRYALHPCFDYRIFALLEDKKIIGMAVWHVETALGVRIMRLTEFLAIPGYEHSLVDEIFAQGLEDGIDLVDFFMSGQRYGSVFFAYGFVEDRSLVEKVPMLFAPLDYSRTQIGCTAFRSPEIACPNSFFHELDHWLITKGDGDQDRPT